MGKVLVRDFQGTNYGWVEVPDIRPAGGVFWVSYDKFIGGVKLPKSKAFFYKPRAPFEGGMRLNRADIALLKRLKLLLPLNPPGTNDPTLDEVNPFG